MQAHRHDQSARRSNRSKWVLAGFLAVAAYFLWTEYQAHLMGALPFLLLLACPLMHLFHHHGQRGRHADHEHAGQAAPRQTPHQAGDDS